MAILLGLKNWLKELLFKFYLYLLRIELSRLGKCKSTTITNIRLALYLKAKLSNNSLVHSDADDDELKKYTSVADSFLGIIETSESTSESIKQLADKIEKENSEFINGAKSDYSNLKEVYDDVTSYLDRCKTNGENFNYKEFHEKIKIAVTKCKELKKKYNKKNKILRDELQEARRELHKYDIAEFRSWLDITKIVALFSAVAYLGGYVYVWSLFSQFEFKFTGFFSASDYLLAPLNQIVYALIFFVFMFFALLSKRVDMATDSKYLAELKERQNKKYFDPLVLLLMIYFLLVGIFHGNNVELSIGVVLAITFYGLPFIIKRYLKPSDLLIKIFIFLICLFSYVGLILHHGYMEHSRIINSSTDSETIVYLDDNKMISNQVFVMKNSEYFFYYNTVEKNINVIPKEHVYRVVSPVKK